MNPNSAGAAGDPASEEFVLSPSENAAHDSALRIAGNSAMRTQKALASIVLGFELIIVVLIGLTLYGLGTLEPREMGLIIGGVLAVVTITALGMMRVSRAGIITGWVLHVLMLATGFLVPMAFIVGAIFSALWVYCMVKGAQIDRDRLAWMTSSE